MTRSLADLNPPQQEAVQHRDGPLLILAGAGSGKTRVITRRIAWLIEEGGVPPEGILAVTFTNKAAGEMRKRVWSLLGPRARDVWVSTFHSAGVRILREDGHHLGHPPNLVIYDDSDQLGVVRRLLKEKSLDDLFTPRKVLSRIDRAKSRGEGPEEMDIGPFERGGDQLRGLYRLYQKALRQAGAVDFGDLLVESVKLLEQFPEVRQKYLSRITHLMVDEFQDTNSVQYRLLELLTGPERNLAVVGDDDQSIYRWRGADVENILSFERDYPGAKVVRLEQNYRSTQTILDAAWEIIRHNPKRKDKKLWTESVGGDPIDVLESHDEQEEAQIIAGALEVMHEAFSWDEMAVFYRVNAQSRAIEDALRRRRIPYHIVRGRSFYDRAEIKDLTAYLRLAVNPNSEADFLRVVNTPRRGIGNKTIERLSTAASLTGRTLIEAARRPPDSLSARASNKVRAFAELIDGLHARVRAEEAPHDIVEAAIEGSGYREALLAEGTEEATDRLENLAELVGAAAQRADEGLGLLDFLDEMALTGDADDVAEEERVNLMTLHAAKGLEFDVVFMTGMEEKTFPHGRAYSDDGYGDDVEEMAEERRLCYVGYTRARKRLLCSWAHTRWLHGQRQVKGPSRFLTGLPEDLLSAPLSGYDRSRAGGHRGARDVPSDWSRGTRAWDEEPRIVPDEPALSEEDGIVVDYAFDQRSPEEVGPRVPRRGGRVSHRTFGIGTIRAVDGSGPEARLTVDFPEVGPKRLVARFVKLI